MLDSLPLAFALSDLLSTKVVALVLWIGLAILSLAVVVITLTKLGQARPLTKCIVLSVFAHVLLGGYAHVTNLFIEHPAPVGEQTLEFQLVDDEPASRDPSESQSLESQPWNQFNSAESLPPDADPLDRQHVNTQPTPVADFVPEPVNRDDWSPANLADNVKIDQPIRTEIQPQETDVTPVQPPTMAVAATPIEIPPTPQRDDPEPIENPDIAANDNTNPLPRRPAETPAAITEEMPLPPGAENDVAEQSESRFNELADAALRAATADAAAAMDDNPIAARNLEQGTQEQDGSGQPKASALTATVAGMIAAAKAAQSIRLGDGRSLPDVYRLRTEELKEAARRLFGGNAKTQAAVDAALAWLVKHQSDDGRWDADALGGTREDKTLGQDRDHAGAKADTGITALCVLALMADGHTHLRGPYRKNTQKGLEFLLASQSDDGNLAGDAGMFASMYCHGMATLALSEAYAVTGDARLKTAVEKAIAYTVESQHRTSGGWRYQPGDLGDMSQFGWQVMALKSAENAGIKIPNETRELMAKFMKSVAQGKGGLASYRPQERPSVTMTAEALTCRYMLGTDLDSVKVAEAVAYIATEPPSKDVKNFYCWYYGTVAMFQHGGPEWNRYNAQLQDALLSTQRTDGEMAGSWDDDTVWGGYGGRAYTTAMGALCLEVYYRYLPIYHLDPSIPPQQQAFTVPLSPQQNFTRPIIDRSGPREALVPLPPLR